MTSSIRRAGQLLRSARLWRVLRIALMLWLLFTALLVGTILIFGRVDRAQSADVIVILGAGLNRDDRPGPALIRRAAQGAALWQRGMAERIICAGGFPLNRPRSEADACAELLRGSGVPAGAIFMEDRSRSTEENALYTREIMVEHDWHSAVLVSDGYHLLRAHWLFDRAGIENYPSPTQDPPLLNLVFSTGREVVAFHWLFVKFLLNLPVTYVPVL